jgi:hypothetical protein
VPDSSRSTQVDTIRGPRHVPFLDYGNRRHGEIEIDLINVHRLHATQPICALRALRTLFHQEEQPQVFQDGPGNHVKRPHIR